MPENMGRIRLDGGLEYQAAPEVVVAFEKMRADLQTNAEAMAAAKADADKVAAERDALKASAQSVDKIKADALEAARAEVKARTALEKAAEPFKVDCAALTDKQVKEAVIKAVLKDADLTNKSDAYIDAAFDLAIESQKDAAIAAQRKAGQRGDDGKPAERADYKSFMAKLGKKE